MQIRRELLDVQRVLGQSFRKAAHCEIKTLLCYYRHGTRTTYRRALMAL